MPPGSGGASSPPGSRQVSPVLDISQPQPSDTTAEARQERALSTTPLMQDPLAGSQTQTVPDTTQHQPPSTEASTTPSTRNDTTHTSPSPEHDQALRKHTPAHSRDEVWADCDSVIHDQASTTSLVDQAISLVTATLAAGNKRYYLGKEGTTRVLDLLYSVRDQLNVAKETPPPRPATTTASTQTEVQPPNEEPDSTSPHPTAAPSTQTQTSEWERDATPPPARADELASVHKRLDAMTSLIGQLASAIGHRDPQPTYSQVASQRQNQGRPPNLRLRSEAPAPSRPRPTRVILRAAQLDKDHPLQKQTPEVLLRQLEGPMKTATGVTAQTVRRLESGDIAIAVSTEEDVQKLFKSNTTWISDALSHYGPVPALRLPGTTQTHCIVVHGVQCCNNPTTIGKAIASRTDTEVTDCHWLLGDARRAQRSHSSLVVKLSNTSDVAKLIRLRTVGIHNELLRIEEFRNRPRLDQCTRCQEFGHLSTSCKAPHPNCRICARAHHTDQHPPCKECTPEQIKEQKGLCPHAKPNCHNCRGDHTATYRTCRVRQDYQRQLALWM